MKKQTLIYSIFGGVTIICFSSLLLWAGSEVKGESLIEKEGTILVSPEARSEYLVDETLDTRGLSFYVEDEEVPLKECEISYDFSSAGDKAITIAYEKEEYIYKGYYDVEVFAVRHLDVRQKTIALNRDGTWDFSNLIIWAELSSAPTEFNKPAEYSDLNDTVIILEENHYTADIQETDIDGYYNVIITAGRAKSSFGFTTGDYPIVNSSDRILKLTNASGGSETLTLFATNSTSNFSSPTGVGQIVVTGTYVFKDASGNRTDYSFKYTLDGWDSYFQSSSFNQGLIEQKGYERDGVKDEDGFKVDVKGLTFYAPGQTWHKAILGG